MSPLNDTERFYVAGIILFALFDITGMGLNLGGVI